MTEEAPIQKKTQIKTSFKPAKTIHPFYTGGKVALDASGRLLATTLDDEVLITDFETGEELARIEGDEETVTTFALSPQATHIAICSRSQTMRIYALNYTQDPPAVDPKLIRSTKAHSAPVIIAEIDPTGTLLATGGAEGLVKVWDIRGGFVTHNFKGHGGVVSALRFYAPQNAEGSEMISGWRLASGADDTKVRVWDLNKRVCLATLDSHVSVVRGLDWSEDGRVLASGSRDQVICLWDAKSWKLRNTIPALEELEVVGFLNQDAVPAVPGLSEQVLFTGGQKNQLRLWNITSGQELTKDVPVVEKEAMGISDVLYQRSQGKLLSVHNDQTLLLHSLEEAKGEAGSLVLPVVRQLSGHHDEIIDLQYVGPNEDVLALATNSEDVRLVAADNSFGDVAVLSGHEEIVICLDRDSSGYWLASGAKDNDARLWYVDPSKKEFNCYAKFTGHAESVGAVALPRSHNSNSTTPPKFLLTGSQDRTIKLWDIPTSKDGKSKAPKALWTRRAHDKDINAIDVSHDDSLFASASQDKTVRIWSLQTGEGIGLLKGHKRGVWSVRFAPSTVSGSVVGGEEGAKGGRLVVTGSGDKTIKLWSLTDYSCLKTFEGHTNSVLKTLWLSAGLQVASSAGDGLVKVWDVRKGECVTTLDNHEDRVWALTLHRNDSTLVSGAGDSVITFWQDTTEETKLAQEAEEEALIEQEQALQNYIQTHDYRSAIALALTLDHPGRLLSIFQSVIATSPPQAGSLSGLIAVDEALEELSDAQIYRLLERIRDWNTNAKTATVAQRILHVIVKKYNMKRMVGLETSKEGKKGRGGVKGLVAAIEAYTERHYRRMEDLVEESFLVDYTLLQMEGLLADEEDRIVKGSREVVVRDKEEDVVML